VITTKADGANRVYAADVDGDGDLDVLSASWRLPPAEPGSIGGPTGVFIDSRIAWYANDGTGQFGPQQVISTTDGPSSLYAADLDGDGDLDVLSAASSRDMARKIAWYANDGTGQFGPQHVISTEVRADSVYAVDLDGDGDLDILSGSAWDQKIAWYANDGTGQFGSQHVISTDGPNCLYPADLDGDGDVDVLTESGWFANDGWGHFVKKEGASGGEYAADLDADGDLDVLSASFLDDKIAWYANDGTGLFGPQQVITTEADGASCVYAADLDGDGDLDVLSASFGDDKIAWHANDGTGLFGPQQVITTEADGAQCAYAADLDGDGDLDILSASFYGYKIAWYENE